MDLLDPDKLQPENVSPAAIAAAGRFNNGWPRVRGQMERVRGRHRMAMTLRHDMGAWAERMPVYHVNQCEYGPQIIRRRRLDVAMIDQLYDPFEFVGVACMS
jgi:hypothetical protein